MKKKILSLVMALLILMTSVVMIVPAYAEDDAWTASDAVAFTVGDGSKDSPYEISSVGNFLYFLSQITTNNASSGKYYKITENIDLGNKEFPLADGTFTGTLDGNNKTISGVYITKTVEPGGNPACAMIKSITGAVIKNVTIEAKIYNDRNTNLIVRSAVLCNELSGGTIENVDIYVDMDYSNNSYWVYAGAFAGRGMGSATLTNCNVYGNIDVTQTNNGNYIGVGGFIGDADAVKFINCNNYASINLNMENSQWGAVGGLVGFHGRSSASTITAQNCVNYGSLNVEKPLTNPVSCIGGIVGFVNKVGSNDLNFSGCANVGSMTIDSSTETGDHLVSGLANINENGKYTFTNCFTAHERLAWVGTYVTDDDCVTGIGLETVKGASIRIMEPSGLRFNTAVPKTTYNALTAIDGISVSFGTVITPTAYVEAAKGYTKAELDAYVAGQPSITNDAYIDIPYDPSTMGWMDAAFEGYDDHYFYSGSVSRINDYTLKYSGISYMTVKLGDLEFTVYSDYNASDNSRSIAYVGYRAVNDTSETQNDIYKFEIGETGIYSPYKGVQLEVIQKFADAYVPET